MIWTQKTVKAIDKAYRERTLGSVNLAGVQQIVMDEFAIQKGHRNATVIVEPDTKRVLWIGRGRSRAGFGRSSNRCDPRAGRV